MVMTKDAPLSTLKPAKIRWITEFGWVWPKILLFPDFFLKGHSHSRIPAAWSCCHDNTGANNNSNCKCSKCCSGPGPKIKILRWHLPLVDQYFIKFMSLLHSIYPLPSGQGDDSRCTRTTTKALFRWNVCFVNLWWSLWLLAFVIHLDYGHAANIHALSWTGSPKLWEWKQTWDLELGFEFRNSIYI